MTDADHLRAANPWRPMARPIDLKHLGKLAEEIAEAVAAVSICVFAGVEGRDPDSGKINRISLEDELADVEANARLVIAHFELEVARRPARFERVSFPQRLVLFLAQLGRAGAAVSRCMIQGIDECEPVTGVVNRAWLEAELEGVLADVELVVDRLGLDVAHMRRRVEKKTAHLKGWHAIA